MNPFTAALRTRHTAVVTAEILTPDGLTHPLKVSSGQVDVDATAQVRRTCSNVVIADPSLAPSTQEALLAPWENELRLWRGIAGIGTYPLGVLGIAEVEVDETSDGLTLTITSGQDRSQSIRENPWTRPYAIQPDTNGADALRAMVTDRLPGAVPNIPPTDQTLPGLLYGAGGGSDPWEDITDVAKALGWEVFFDPLGIFVARTPVDATTAVPAATFGDGQDGRLLGINRKLTRAKSYTQVIAVAQGSTLATPLRSTWPTVDTSSRPRPYLFVTSAISTQDDLNTAAQALYTRVSGQWEDITITGVPDPRLDVGTAVRVVRGELDRVAVLDRISLGLAPADTMTGSLRGGVQ
ncbi:MAG TPA: DUF5047 domain-containing protein [Nocardioidaceae bacterium]|nr:DUF5047 domain-containing protein [Nocardioidaceae bacterium]